jgi:uncharacterized protein (TIGR00369 family)
MSLQNLDRGRMPANAEGASREAIEAIIESTPFASLLGARIIEFSSGKVALLVPINGRLLQHHRFVHGAVVGFVADSACAWAAASRVGDVVTSEYKLNFLAPAGGTSLIGRGEVIKISGRQVVCRADIFAEKDGAERLVATALGTIARFERRSEAVRGTGCKETDRR